MSLQIVILAAGQGKRMHSSLAKVLHPLAGKPILAHVIETAISLSPQTINIVYGHQGEAVKSALAHYPVTWVKQEQQLGTGHAVAQALPLIAENSQVLVLYGDVPLIKATTLKNLCELTGSNNLGLLVANVSDPSGLGRIIRDDTGNIINVIEHKDADAQQLQITEIFSGIILAPAAALKRWLRQLNNDNAQQEYYLPQIVTCAMSENTRVLSARVGSDMEVQGINDRQQLNKLERYYQQLLARQLMLEGVTIADAQRIDIRGQLQCEQDVNIDINVLFEGNNRIGKNSRIGPNCIIKNTIIGDNVIIAANSIVENSEIANGCQIGPFARLRPGTVLKANAKIGNFVETKKSTIGESSKVNHLSYIGDTTIGNHVNIGAGTITCNYDGVNKHQTIIEDGVNIGSDTQLIAPVRVGKNATIGAGTTVRKDAPANQLTLNDTKQKSIAWERPLKKQHERD